MLHVLTKVPVSMPLTTFFVFFIYSVMGVGGGSWERTLKILSMSR